MITAMFGRFRIQKRRILKQTLKPKNTSYHTFKEPARILIHERLRYYNQFYNLTYNRVAIKDQRRCWGSCSSKGNLNFSYKLLFLPACLRDYVILHELCHLVVLNHSQDFWNQMSRVMPDYATRAAALRQLERTHGTAQRTLAKLQPLHTCPHCVGHDDYLSDRVLKENWVEDVVTA